MGSTWLSGGDGRGFQVDSGTTGTPEESARAEGVEASGTVSESDHGICRAGINPTEPRSNNVADDGIPRRGPCPTCCPNTNAQFFLCNNVDGVTLTPPPPPPESRSLDHVIDMPRGDGDDDGDERTAPRTRRTQSHRITVIIIASMVILTRRLEPLLMESRLVDVLIMVIAEACFTMVQIESGGRGGDRNKSTQMPNATKFLLHAAWTSSVIGFLCCLYSILLRVIKPRCAAIFAGLGFVAAVVGFLALMGTLLSENLKLCVPVALTCVALLTAFALSVHV